MGIDVLDEMGPRGSHSGSDYMETDKKTGKQALVLSWKLYKMSI